MNIKKKFKVGIIGLGVGEKHLQGYLKCKNTEIVYAVDKNILKLKHLKKKYKNINFIQNSQKVFEDKNIDIVSIATFDDSHYDLIMTAIKSEKHIFVEKPMCQFSWQLKMIEKKLQQKRLILFSNLILRKSKLFIDLKKKMTQKFFGKVFHIEADYNYGRVHKIKSKSWRSNIPFYSVTQGGGIHLVDLILWMTNKKPKSVFSYANNIASKNFKFKYPDNVLAIFKLDDDCTLKISVKFASVNKHHHNLSIYGTKKTFENLTTGPIIHHDSNNDPKKSKQKYKSYKKSNLIEEFVKCIQNKKKYNFNEFKNPLKLCFAIEKSYKTNKEIKL